MLIELSEENEMRLQENGFLGQGILPLHHHLQQGCFEEGSEFSDHPYLCFKVLFLYYEEHCCSAS
jgi:hypothetical protein